MPLNRVNPSSLAHPSGFAHAVTDGNLIYLAGQTALDQNGKIVPGGIVQQFRQAFTNVLTALEAAGGRPEHLAAVTIYLVDIPDYQKHGREIGQIWRELAGSEYPAMAGIGITALWQPDALIEIQAIASVVD
jgi:enamine deaminase RidA (YjgF/YER057c/UK114 family)